MQGGRCRRRNAGWLASSVVRGAPEGRHHAAAAVRGPPCRERAPAGRLDQEAATVALAVRQTPAPRRPVRGHRAVTASIGPPRARPPPAARRGARRVPAGQALARPRASPPQRRCPPCVSRLAHAASAPHVRGNRGPPPRKMSQAGNRRVCKAPGAGSYRAKKGAMELARAARRIKAGLAAAAADPSPVLAPTTQDAPLAVLGPDGMVDADPAAPAHVAFHLPAMLPVLPNYGD